MTATDCRHRGDDGHLPHPGDQPCIVNTVNLGGRRQAPSTLARLLADVEDVHDAELQQAREHAAECMREAAQLHRQLDSLGTSPDRLAEQVGARMAVVLYGRTYVDRDTALTEGALRQAGLAPEPAGELLEAAAGVFVPLPKGYRLEVSVTPWDDVPDPAADLAEPATHVCSTLCHAAGCPGTA